MIQIKREFEGGANGHRFAAEVDGEDRNARVDRRLLPRHIDMRTNLRNQQGERSWIEPNEVQDGVEWNISSKKCVICDSEGHFRNFRNRSVNGLIRKNNGLNVVCRRCQPKRRRDPFLSKSDDFRLREDSYDTDPFLPTLDNREEVPRAIVGEKMHMGVRHFIVQWEGFGDDDVSCEPLGAIQNTIAFREYLKAKEAEEEFEVEKIRKHKVSKTSGRRVFKVRWLGYDRSYDSYEPERNVAHLRAYRKYARKHLSNSSSRK